MTSTTSPGGTATPGGTAGPGGAGPGGGPATGTARGSSVPRPAPTTRDGSGSTRGDAPSGAAPPRSAAAARGPRSGGRPRRARLVLRRVDPWSVFKLALVISTALLVVAVVAVLVLYLVLEGVGFFDSVTSVVNTLTGSEDDAGGLELALSAGRVLAVTALLGAVYVLLTTALATLGAVLYNVCADLTGGLEVTLTEA